MLKKISARKLQQWLIWTAVIESAKNMFPVAQIISILNQGFVWKIKRGDNESTIANEFSEKIIMALQKAMRNR